MMNNLPKLSDDNNTNTSTNDVEDLMRVASEKIDNNVEAPKESNANLNKVFKASGAVMGVFAILLVAGAVIVNKPQTFEDKTAIKNSNNNVQEPSEPEFAEASNDEWSFQYPVEVQDWTKRKYDQGYFLINEDNEKVILKDAQNIPGFYNSVSWMPSGIKGNWEGADEPYTNNISEIYLKDKAGRYTKNKNPKYKYALKEDYEKAYLLSIQRLINPTFGEWVFAQRSDNKTLRNDTTFNVLKDMFHEDWWNENVKEGEDYSKLPILVDWNQDDFGGLEFAERIPGRYGTFFGAIDESGDKKVQSSVLGTNDKGVNIIEVTTPVKYSAFGRDDKIINKYGTIKLTFGSSDTSHNPIIITSVEFSID